MAQPPRIPTIVGISDDIDAAIDLIVSYIERANNPTADSPLEVVRNPTGFHWRFIMPPVVFSAVSTSTITAASGSTFGSGTATLRLRSGATQYDGPSVLVYSNFSVSVATATRLEIVQDGEAYKLLGADCPP